MALVEDIDKLKLPQLKKELKALGLDTSGNKTQLKVRLETALKNSESSTGMKKYSSDLLEEYIFTDEFDANFSTGSPDKCTDIDEQSVLETLENSRTSESGEEKEEKLLKDPEDDSPKKIKLDRKFEQFLPQTNEDLPGPLSPSDPNPKKMIKLSDLSTKERLELRAKKFGTSAGPDLAKAVRAERFGIQSSQTNEPESTKLDVLKQRALRFGGSVSTVMSSLEQKEKLEKRKHRFAGSE